MQSIIDNIVSQITEHTSLWIGQIISYIPGIILSVIVLAVSYKLSGWMKKKTNDLSSKYIKDKSIVSLVSSVVAAGIILFSLLMTLIILDLDEVLTSILATAGVAGLAVGMALQEPMANTFSGITMSIRNFYNIGDWISTNDMQGQIKSIRLRWTELQKPSGERIFLPNKMIVSNPVENYSIAGRRQIEIECGVDYSSDLEKVERLTKRTIANTFSFVDKPKDVIFFYKSFGDSSIVFVARFWVETKSLLKYNITKSEAMIALKKVFDHNDIGIPFPTRTLDIDWNKLPLGEKISRKKPPHEMESPGRSSAPNRTPFWNKPFSEMKA